MMVLMRLIKNIVFIFLLLTLFMTAGRVMAETPPNEGPATLTPSGSSFPKGASDGQCKISGAQCTTANNTSGTCIDNGLGAGVCSDEPTSEPSSVVLTPSGTPFKNGSSDGQCAVAGASCTTSSKIQGVCVDNGLGVGVCTSAKQTIDPLFDNGCDPNTICHVVGEAVSGILHGGQSEHRTYGRDPTGLTINYLQNWIGQAKPSGSYLYGTDQLVKWGQQMFNAASDILPAELQNMTVHDVQPKRFCTTSRICIYNPWSHELQYQWISDEQWCTEDPPERRHLIEGTRWFSGFISVHTASPFMALNDTKVKRDQPPPCGAKLGDGRVMDETSLPFTNRNYYGNAITQWTVDLVAALVTGPVTKTVERKDGTTKEVQEWYADVPSNAVIKKGSENSFSASTACISFTCTQGDLKPFAYPVTSQAKEDLTHGGIWDTYRPALADAAFKSATNAIGKDQNWYTDIPGFGAQSSDTLQSMNARQENAQLFGNCAIMPAGIQANYFGNQCNQSWAATPSEVSAASESVPPSVPNTSTWASTSGGSSAKPIQSKFSAPSPIASNLVPSCVLEGVAKIEGAYDGGAPCKNNECGAYGPFQITTGQCTSQCGASSCPNAAKALGVTKDQLCDFGTAAAAAARLLVGKSKYFGYTLSTADPKTQRDAIIIAGDSYYGITKPIARLGGLSYGEWVYAHCDPNYTTHVDHSFPPPGGATQF